MSLNDAGIARHRLQLLISRPADLKRSNSSNFNLILRNLIVSCLQCFYTLLQSTLFILTAFGVCGTCIDGNSARRRHGVSQTTE